MPIPLGILAVAGAGGGAAGAYELIETSLISSTTASVTFSTLPTSYTHLQIRLTGRSNRADFQDQTAIRFNGVTTTTYASHTLRATGAVVQSSNQTSFGFMFAPQAFDLFAASESASRFGAGIIDILDFKNGNKTKTIRMLSGTAGGTQVRDIALTSGFNTSTDALTSVTIFPRNGSWVSGTRISIYGIKG
jgi:hypothetical protein